MRLGSEAGQCLGLLVLLESFLQHQSTEKHYSLLIYFLNLLLEKKSMLSSHVICTTVLPSTRLSAQIQSPVSNSSKTAAKLQIQRDKTTPQCLTSLQPILYLNYLMNRVTASIHLDQPIYCSYTTIIIKENQAFKPLICGRTAVNKLSICV